MAYAYKAVDELLNPESQKQNIFASEQGPQGQGSTAPQGQDVKTSTEGEMGGSSGGSTPQMQTQAPVADEGKAARTAVQANAGKVAQPKAITDVQGQLQRQQENLQTQANSYVETGKQNQQYALADNDLESAISGDQDKKGALRGLLDRKNINQVSDFKADVGVKDSELFNNEAGLKHLVSRGQDPQYSGGMAAFDVGALRRTPGFDRIVGMIQGQNRDLQAKAAEYAGTKRKEVEDYGTAQLGAAQEGAKKYLASQSAAIDTANDAETLAANEALKGYRTNGAGEGEAKALQDAKAAVEAVYKQNKPNYAQFVPGATADTRKYLTVRDDYKRDDFVDAKEAERFNSIMSLLGQGDTRFAAGGRGEDYSIDKASLERDLFDSTSKLGAEQDAKDAKKRALDEFMAGQRDLMNGGLAQLSSGREEEEALRNEPPVDVLGPSPEEMDELQNYSADPNRPDKAMGKPLLGNIHNAPRNFARTFKRITGGGT